MKRLLLLSILVLASMCWGQTTTQYFANSGYVSSYNAVTGYLENGGAFHSPYGMGSGCYYGGCPAWQFFNYPFSYILPDGTTANFTNFSGTANFTNQFDITVQGTASGIDSTGTSIRIKVNWAFKAVCRSGRGGGCSKTFLDGESDVTK